MKGNSEVALDFCGFELTVYCEFVGGRSRNQWLVNIFMLTKGSHLMWKLREEISIFFRLKHQRSAIYKCKGRSQPCKKCALCGHFNHYKSMVHQTSTITAANGKIFALKQTLDCSNYDIYVATCRLCHKQYIGQTINKFSKRWCHHRFIWNQFKYDNIDDKAALLHHYHTFHQLTLQTKPDIADCFFVTFVGQTPKHLLSIYENIWLDKLKATININKMLLPSIKCLCKDLFVFEILF